MKRIKYFIIYIFTGVLWTGYFTNVPTEIDLQNGGSLNVLVSGDEYFNYLHDSNGFTIIQSPKDGHYYYATRLGDDVVPSLYRADLDLNPSSLDLVPYVIISKGKYMSKRNHRLVGMRDRDAPTIGTINNLNIFIRFADENEFSNPRSYYDSYFNDINGPSMKHYFDEVSYQLLTVNTHHFPLSDNDSNLSYQDEYPRSYYQPYNQVTNPNGYMNDNQARQREHTLLKNAIELISSEVPQELNIDSDGDGYVDSITFLVSGAPGAWADLLWPHMWSLCSVEAYIHGKRVMEYNFNLSVGDYFSVGTLCHEFAHTLGAPDLYHYWDNVAPVAVGGWDIMDASTNIPQWPSAYIKHRYFNWIDLIDASSGGTFTISPLGEPTNNAYKVNSSNPNEFFILEYRTQEGIYDSNAPGEDKGILIYRVNNLYNGQGNGNGPPDELYLYRVGGTLTSSGSFGAAVFSAETGRVQFNDTTNPSAFLSDGSNSGVNITDIGSSGSTIEFTVLNLMLLSNYLGIQEDLDGDGILNPGESATISINIDNMSEDVLAYSVTGELSSSTDVSFFNPIVNFGDLYAGQSSEAFSVDIILSDDIVLGDIPISLDIESEYIQNNNVLFYNDQYNFKINVSLNQSGFPIEFYFPALSSPIMIDVDQDSQKEILFGDFDGKIRAFNIDGSLVQNNIFPFTTGSQIWASIAKADIDLDGTVDYMVGSKDKFLYLFDVNGFKGAYNAESFLIGTPAIGNLDEDPELEIVFGGFSSGNGRNIYALNHDLSDVDGFPVYIGEKIKYGVALSDFNGNGIDDIVFGTDSDNIYLLYDSGSIADGFPYTMGDKISGAPSIIKNDETNLIVAGSEDGFLYGINSLGELEFIFQADSDISTSLAFLNFQNQCYIIFGDNDGMLYVVDTYGSPVSPFPIDAGGKISKSVVLSDINLDNIPDIIYGTDTGQLNAVSIYGNQSIAHMPIMYPFSFESAPLVYDIDGDLDQEILIGTSQSLNVYDVKQNGENIGYWSMFRGNEKRNGVHVYEPYCLNGDLNGDISFDITDIIVLINIILDLIDPTPAELCSGDLNFDGQIDLFDAILLVDLVLETH